MSNNPTTYDCGGYGCGFQPCICDPLRCRVCESAIAFGELCEPCAVGNDPFQQSKWSVSRE